MPKEAKKFIISVVPLVKLPLNRDQYFYYLADEKIPSSTLVQVPLFRKQVTGIVIKSDSDFSRLGNIQLKKIDTVVEEGFLSEKQLALASYLSDRYFCSLGTSMRCFVPQRTKQRKKKEAPKISPEIKPATLKLTEQQLAAVSQVVKSDPKSPSEDGVGFLLFAPAGAGKTEVYLRLIEELSKQDPDGQFLILLPEKTLTPQAIERYGQRFNSANIALLSSNLSKGEFYANWKKIKSGQTKIIIGTRMAVFAPFKKLALIMIDEEQDNSFKQWDMNPRYDARVIAQKLASLFSARIVFGSATPRLETYYQTQTKKLRLLSLPELELPGLVRQKSEFCLVDMKKERWEKNDSCLSKKLRSEIGYALKNKLQTILFINRQGMSNFSLCEKCRSVLRCPDCDRALIFDNSTGNYRCIHCDFGEIFPHCSGCGNITFKNIGLGTQKVEKETASFFPQARIARIDTGCAGKMTFQEQLYREFSQGKIDILIGTQMITKGWDLPKLSLVGVIDADNLFSFPDFNTDEKAFCDLTQLSGRVARPGAIFPGVVVVQTYHPQNRLLGFFEKKDYAGFAKKELENRKILQYPPLGKIARLLFQDYNQEKVMKETERVSVFLINLNSKASISEPSAAFVEKIRGKYRRQIIIKYQDKLPAEVAIFLKTLPSGWIIDIDPISTL